MTGERFWHEFTWKLHGNLTPSLSVRKGMGKGGGVCAICAVQQKYMSAKTMWHVTGQENL